MTQSTYLHAPALAVLLTVPASANAQEITFWDFFAIDRIGAVAVQSLIGVARSYAEVHYQDLDIRLLDGRAAISGLVISPYDQERNPGCTITIDRVAMSFAPVLQTEIASVDVNLSGAMMPITCLDPWDREGLEAFGIEELAIDQGIIRAHYVNASSALDVDFYLTSSGYGSISGDAEFAYAALNIDDEEPIADLRSAYFEFTNDGLWEIFESELPPFIFNAEMLNAMLQQELLSEPIQPIEEAAPTDATPDSGPESKPGDTPPDAQVPAPEPAPAPVDPVVSAETEEAREFIREATETVADFAADPGTISLSLSPDEPVRLEEDLFNRFETAVAALNPELGLGAPEPEIASADLASALRAHFESGDLDEGLRLDLAAALIDGAGVPRSPELALDVLGPLLEEGNDAAFSVIGDHLDLIAPEDAYAILHAAASQDDTARLRLDAAERRLGLDGVLAIQGLEPTNLDVDLAADDLAVEARAALLGTGRPRHYADAYFLALLSEAGGDRSARALVDMLEDRGRFTDAPDLWDDMLGGVRELAFDTWLAGQSSEDDADDEAPAADE